MADKGKGLYRLIALVFDSAESRKATKAMEDALARAGEIGGKGLQKELRDAYNLTIAEAKAKFGQGSKQFQKIANDAAQAFNSKLGGALQKLRAEGKLTDAEFVSLSRSLKRVGDDGVQHVGRIHGAFTKLIGLAAGLFAFNRIRLFGEDALREAADADRVWSKLGATVNNAGVDFKAVRGDIDDAAEAFKRSTRFGDEEFATVLQTLVRGTGDYAGSLKNVSLVADVAVGANLDLEAAAKVVSKAMEGNTTALAKLGIIIPKNADAIEVLRQRFRGLAEGDAKTLAGRVDQLSVSWGDFKKAIGFAMFDAAGGTSTIETLTGSVRDLTEEIKRDGPAIAAFARDLANIAIAGAQALATLVRMKNPAAAEAGDMIAGIRAQPGFGTPQSAARLAVRLGVERGSLAATEAQIKALGPVKRSFLSSALPNPNQGVQGHIDQLERLQVQADASRRAIKFLEDELAKLAHPAPTIPPIIKPGETDPDAAKKAAEAREKALDTEAASFKLMREVGVLTADAAQRALVLELQYRDMLDKGNLSLDQRTRILDRIKNLQAVTFGLGSGGEIPATQNTTKIEIGKIGATGAGGLIAGADTERQKVALQTLTDYYRDSFKEIEGVVANAFMGMAGAWQDAFGIIFKEGATLGKFFGALGKGIAGALLGGLAEFASSKMQQNIAWAFEDVALGIADMFWNPPRAGADFAAAAQHGVAAAAWGVLAGATGAGQSAITGGRGASGGIPSGATDIGGRIADNTQPRGPEINIYVDGFDPHNPHHQDMVGYSQQELRERWGEDSTIHYYPRTGG